MSGRCPLVWPIEVPKSIRNSDCHTHQIHEANSSYTHRNKAHPFPNSQQHPHRPKKYVLKRCPLRWTWILVLYISHLVSSLPHFYTLWSVDGTCHRSKCKYRQGGNVHSLHCLATTNTKVQTYAGGHHKAWWQVRIFLQYNTHITSAHRITLEKHFYTVARGAESRD